MPQPIIRPAQIADANDISMMCEALWPDTTAEEHRKEVVILLESGVYGTLPATIFVAQDESVRLTGFLQVGLRSHADGCDAAHPVGFIEGWYVYEPTPSPRNRTSFDARR